jgi:hypothetical protein
MDTVFNTVVVKIHTLRKLLHYLRIRRHTTYIPAEEGAGAGAPPLVNLSCCAGMIEPGAGAAAAGSCAAVNLGPVAAMPALALRAAADLGNRRPPLRPGAFGLALATCSITPGSFAASAISCTRTPPPPKKKKKTKKHNYNYNLHQDVYGVCDLYPIPE